MKHRYFLRVNHCRKIMLVLTGLIAVVYTNAQHQEINDRPGTWKEKEQVATDTSSLFAAFRQGTMHGHFRYHFMATDNTAGLLDFYAHALGGGIKYETAKFHRFQFGVSGFFIFNIGSSDLTKTDATTGQPSRYEIGLFDIENPANKSNIDRLEELYLKYSWKNAQVTIGRQLINSSFINLQDGRMRPTEVGGLYTIINSIRHTKIEAGLLNRISPRSTVRWFTVGESVGVYSTGVNTDGTKSGYAGNLHSKGIALVDITHRINSHLSLKLHDLFVENIMNAGLLQADFTFLQKNNNTIVAGLQYIREDAVHNGGNTDPARSYMTKGAKANVLGVKTGWENKRWHTSLNYTRITGDGRYLMPREWGREPFFTFLPRERNEGLGDVNAYMAKLTYTFTKAKLKTQAALGYYDLPDVKNVRLNKYGLPTYTQLNLDIRYEFSGLLKGLDAQFLFVYKKRNGDYYGNYRYVINKADVMLWNMVLNYHF